MHEVTERLYLAAKTLRATEGQSAVAKLLNESPQVVKNWEGRGVSKAGILKAASALGARAEWIATGVGPMQAAPNATSRQLESNVAEAPALAPSRRVPVVGHVKGGIDGYLEEMQFPVGHGEGFVEYWTKDPSAYALRVKGDSMHPRYRAREFIVVTPSIEPQPGHDVVVKLRDGRKLLKQLNWIRDDEIQLVSINDGYAPTTLQAHEVDSIQRVAGGVPADAFQESRND